VFGGVAGDAVVSAAPDLVEPGVGEDAYGVGVVVAAGEGAVVEVVGGPGVGSAGVAGEVADGVAQLFATGPTESDRAHLARLSGGGATPARQASASLVSRSDHRVLCRAALSAMTGSFSR